MSNKIVALMKHFLFYISSIFPIRLLTQCFLKIAFLFSRLFSYLKFKALVRYSGFSVCHWSVEIKYGKNIIIGNNTSIGPNSVLGAMEKIVIGDFVRISRGVVIETAGLDFSTSLPYKHKAKPIIIGNGVWIASNAIILGGVSIGENSIIGAGAVVTKDVPSNSIYVGSKGRVLLSAIS